MPNYKLSLNPMSSWRQSVTKGLLCLAIVCLWQPADAQQSKWIKTGVTGRLIYVPDPKGDRILDFSNVGYKGRGSELLPNNVPTVVTVSPIEGDDTGNIQAAINAVSALPMQADGYRGAVLLSAGHYDIETQLNINASGVVLRGVGRETTGTVLHARGTTQRTLVQVTGAGSQSMVGPVYSMADKVVPAGANSFRLNTTVGLAIGQTVRVERPGTQAWIDAIGMNVALGPEDPAWVPGDFNLRSDRVITRIEGNRVFVDAPLATSFDVQFGGGTLQRYTWSGRIENVGVENFRAESDFNAVETSGSDFSDEDHAWTFLSANNSQNVWFRNSLTKYFGYGSAQAGTASKWFTVDNVINEEPVSIVTGSRRYTFDLDGQMGFVTNSTASKGRHDFVNNGAAKSTGPNVFHNSSATNVRSDTGPHRRWSTGTLFDNISVSGHQMNARYRGSYGTTHGWSGANMVFWNTTANGYYVQNPPTSQNWLIGATGTIGNDTTFGPQPAGYYDSPGTKVTAGGELSLYDAQSNDSANIREFHWSAATGNWNDALAWPHKVTPAVYKVQLRDYLLGDIDNFTNDGSASVDNAYVDPAWYAAIDSLSVNPLTGFDDANINRNVVFTVQHALDSGERVVHGFLAISLKAASASVATDYIRLFDTAATHQLNFSSLGWASQVNTSTPFVGVLDLGDSLDLLQSGAINVQVNHNTMVDWAIYTAAVATPMADPVGASVVLDGGSVRVDSATTPIASLVNGGLAASSLELAPNGIVQMNDSYEQFANGTLKIEIGGTAPGQFGKLNISHNALLNGFVELQLVNGYSPSLGDEFQFLTASNLMNTVFSATSFPNLGPTLGWDLSYGPGSVTARIISILEGDYNRDGIVDSADYTVWRHSFGNAVATPGDGADGNRNGSIDLGDYQFWRERFGNVAGAGMGSAAALAVPEPATHFSAVLLVLTSSLASRRGFYLPPER
ncbi:MAG: hypothetical protein IT425_02855 [Pirellulales bacterium]|nr:hypothetical protein [Pirellulales bacterium]